MQASRLLRDEVVILTDSSAHYMKRFKDDAKEVTKGYECGAGLKTSTTSRSVISSRPLRKSKKRGPSN